MRTTLNQMVRDQILAEGPQFHTEYEREYYLNGIFVNMPNDELLERISDAFERAKSQMAVNPLI